MIDFIHGLSSVLPIYFIVLDFIAVRPLFAVRQCFRNTDPWACSSTFVIHQLIAFKLIRELTTIIDLVSRP